MTLNCSPMGGDGGLLRVSPSEESSISHSPTVGCGWGVGPHRPLAPLLLPSLPLPPPVLY